MTEQPEEITEQELHAIENHANVRMQMILTIDQMAAFQVFANLINDLIEFGCDNVVLEEEDIQNLRECRRILNEVRYTRIA